MTDLIRELAPPVRDVMPCASRPLPQVTNVFAKQGLRYEKKVGVALASTASRLNAELHSQPWFSFNDSNGPGCIVPDFIFSCGDITLVIEVKLTWVPVAELKLQKLYVPVLSVLFPHTRLHPLIITRSVTPNTVHLIDNLHSAVSYVNVPTLQWLGHGAIRW